MELPGCEITVGEMIACAEDFSEFWQSRTCTTASLMEDGPPCGDDLAERCPVLYGEEEPTPTTGCTGVAPLCSTQTTMTACTALDGCLWSSTDDECTGVSRSCSLITNSADCEMQSGCSWME
jgi:hypothetical protein